MGAAPSAWPGRSAARAAIAARPRYTAWPWASTSVLDRRMAATPEPSGAGDRSALARAAASDTRKRPSLITLQSPRPPAPVAGQIPAVSREPPPAPPGQVGGGPDCRQAFRGQRGRLARWLSVMAASVVDAYKLEDVIDLIINAIK